MSRDALRKQVDNVLHDISSIKIPVLGPDSHPLYQKMIPKHPLVALEIPNKLFLLWSDLKSIKVEKQPSITAASKHLNLLKKVCKIIKSSILFLQLIPLKQGYEVFKNLQQISWSTWGAKRAV